MPVARYYLQQFDRNYSINLARVFPHLWPARSVVVRFNDVRWFDRSENGGTPIALVNWIYIFATGYSCRLGLINKALISL